MKNIKVNRLMIFASAGALIYAGTSMANDAQLESGAKAGNTDAQIELRGDINEPAGAELKAHKTMGHQLHRASELIGTDVKNNMNEKFGEVRDVVIDLDSGEAPFAVVSSGGFFGVGDRYLAIPTKSFSHSRNTEDDESIILSMDRERLRAAPSFDRSSWPDLSDQSWQSEVNSYYGSDSSMNQESALVSTRTTINEPAGANRSVSSRMPGQSSAYSQSYGETTTGLSRDRTPRQGLGAEDLTMNEQKIRNPGGYAESDSFFKAEAAGTERPMRIDSHTQKQMTTKSTFQQSNNSRRASELIGMEVKNSQGERVGEIKDVVLDLDSGRVAYTVLSPSGYSDMGDRLYAIPTGVYSRSAGNRTLVLNTDKEMLRSAPGFERNNWSEVNNREFTTRVYRHYNQPLYWQSSTEIREPSGTQLENGKNRNRQNDSRDSSSDWQRGVENSEPIDEPSGAERDNQSQNQIQNGTAIEDPSGAEPERNQSVSPDEANTSEQSSAAKEAQELQAADPNANSNEENAVEEPAGAATSTTPATRADQTAGNEDRGLSERLRNEFRNDDQLSSKTQNVQVSTTNGRITLRGSVASEQDKQAVEAKARQLAGGADKVDNQLQVTDQP